MGAMGAVGARGAAGALWLLLFLLGIAVGAQETLPKPAGRVTDLANVIDASTEGELTARLQRLEDQTSHEVAVVTVTSLGGTTVEDYAERLFKAWGVGQEKQDNGVLVVVAPNEREMRIEVGYGLEGILPDGLAGEIIRDSFIPRFRNDDYNGGIRDGVLRVADIVEKQQVLSAEEIARLNDAGRAGNDEPPAWIIIPFFGLFVGIGFTMLGIGLRGKVGFPVLFGSLFGGMPLMMSLAFLGRLSLVTLVPFAVLALFYGFRLGAKKSVRDSFRNQGGKGKGGGSSGGWVMGGGSSSGSSSSSGGSSSSFGGGSSGGGGASGRW
jgi:uncharacterized protein